MEAKKWIGIIFMTAMVMVGFLGCHKSEEAELGGMGTIPEPTVANADVPVRKPDYEVVSTPIPKPSNTLMPEPVATNMPLPEPTADVAPTPQPVDTPTPKPEATNTPVPKPSNTPTPEPTPSNTPVPVPTITLMPTPIPNPPKPTTPPKPMATPLPAYHPDEHGYTEKVGEWKYGEEITATLWWNGIKWGNDGKACVLVFEGTGETWTAEEAEVVYNKISCPWVGLEDYTRYIYEVIIGEGITKVSDLQVSYSKHITLPNSLKEIGSYAFSASRITSIVIPEGVERIGNHAFYCSKLVSVVISEGVEYIGECAFDRCNLTEIKLPDSLRFLGSAAFGIQYVVNAEENLVSEVVIPAGVETIEFGAFIGRYGMKIYLEGRSSDAGFEKGWDDGGFDREIEVVYNYKR